MEGGAGRSARLLLWFAAACFAILGLVAFVLPAWASENFPWRVGPFVAMTIGGWSLGTAGIALVASRERRPSVQLPMLLFLAVFGAGELLVVLAFRERLQVGLVLAWPYLAGLVSLLVAGVLTAVDWRRTGANVRGPVGRVPAWAKLGTALFVVFVGGLVVATFIAPQGGGATEGRFVPERMGLFTVRAFCAFFFAIVVAALSLFVLRDLRPWLELARVGMFLIVPITLASLVNLHLFDFVGRPGTALYLGAYVGVGILLTVILLAVRPRPDPAEATAARADDAPGLGAARLG